MTTQSEFIEINWDGRSLQLEISLIGKTGTDSPFIVFLHEGLGSISSWKDFPTRLCNALSCRGLVYSRPGYGQSTPFDQDASWGMDFMHRQAYEVLPILLDNLEITPANHQFWLFGHSDGASIALLYASAFSDHVNGLIVVAPHILVEDLTIQSIEQLEQSYKRGDLRDRLAVHHCDPDSTFSGWIREWLSAEFRNWSIVDALNRIQAPLLAIQGTSDEYGTYAQVAGIAERVPDVEIFEIAGCRHSPHRTHPDTLLDRSAQYIRKQISQELSVGNLGRRQRRID